MIIDISHHQLPSKIDYDKLAKQVKLVIVRTQYGSRTIDRHYKTHHKEFKKRGVPTAAYAWVRGVSIKDMEVEATDFYNRTKEFEPTFWFLDVEEKSMKDMRTGVNAYLKKLRELGAKNIGVYIGHHLYKSFNLNVDEFDAVWIPHYGKNDGTHNSKPSYPCDLHQYTDKGRLDGYDGYLDLNRLTGSKKLSYFVGEKKKQKTKTKLPNGILKTGSRGDAVKQLQQALNDAYFKPGEIDGIYGPKTEDAVRRFQMVHDAYRVDGIYGPRTKKRLEKVLK